MDVYNSILESITREVQEAKDAKASAVVLIGALRQALSDAVSEETKFASLKARIEELASGLSESTDQLAQAVVTLPADPSIVAANPDREIPPVTDAGAPMAPQNIDDPNRSAHDQPTQPTPEQVEKDQQRVRELSKQTLTKTLLGKSKK